jgi:hypothetical protein
MLGMENLILISNEFLQILIISSLGTTFHLNPAAKIELEFLSKNLWQITLIRQQLHWKTQTQLIKKKFSLL